MKKILVLLSTLLISTNSYAGIIALNTISADAGAAGFNDNFNVVKNAINGQIQGSATTGSSTNILAGSIGVLDMGPEDNGQLRDSELLGVGVDTTSVSNSFVYSGLTPATSANLTSNVSAGTAYITGYRVVKVATAQTYAASMDTYLDLSTTGVFTQSAVAVGATAPAVAANSARLAKVTTSGVAITSVTDLSNRRLPGLVVPTNFRAGLYVSWDSATTMKVFPGICEVNGLMVSKTTPTTLTISTAGNWAGGSSLQAVSTYGYVGTDSGGNILMHTTAPQNQNYGLTVTQGKLRYASWSSTTYRVLGWFYMNSTGAGQLNQYEVGNIKEADVSNSNTAQSSASVNSSSTTFANDANALMHFYCSGNPLYASYVTGTGNSGANLNSVTLSVDAAGIAGNQSDTIQGSTTTNNLSAVVTQTLPAPTVGGHTIQGQYKTSGGTAYMNSRSLTVEEK